MADADDLRERLRGLSRANQPALGSELSERMASQLRALGPGIVRRSRRRRMLLASSLAVLPSLIIVGVWGLQRAATGGTRAEVESQAKPAQCAALAAPARQFAGLPAGRRLLDLGARGRIALDAGGVAELVSSDPCKLELLLAQGRVSVHAQNLFGGELRVRAGATDVVVHGTRFAVDRSADGVTVDVDEGAVGVERAGRASAALVRGGQRLRVADTHAPVLLALAEEQRVQLRAALAFAPVTQVSQPEAAAVEQPSGATLARAAEEPARASAPAASLRAVEQSRGSSVASRARRAEEPARTSTAPRTRAISAPPARVSEEPSRTSVAAPARVSEEPSRTSAAALEEPVGASPSEPAEPQAREVAAQPELARAAEPAPAAPARREPVPQPTAARAPTAAQLVARADALWSSGNRDAARDRYREAGAASNDPTAEAAWLALARRELSSGRADAAREALAGYAARFPDGELRDEAVGIAFRVALADDDDALAERLARSLVVYHPGTTQARAAARWLRERGLPP